jgi:hypothetical protein
MASFRPRKTILERQNGRVRSDGEDGARVRAVEEARLLRAAAAAEEAQKHPNPYHNR